MTTYRRYAETCDNEGETWTFWLQVDGNMTALALLDIRLDALAGERDDEFDDYPYELHDDQIEAHEVDLLVRFGGEGYMALHTKVDGALCLPKDFLSGDLYTAERLLYKGGIKKFFTASARNAVQFDGRNRREVLSFVYPGMSEDGLRGAEMAQLPVVVETPEGDRTVDPGEWVLQTSPGVFEVRSKGYEPEAVA